MAKKAIDKNINDIKKILKSKKILFGTKLSLKELRQGKLVKIYHSLNAPSDIVRDIQHYSGMTGTEVVPLKYPNSELGTLCKRPFSVSVIAVKK